MSQGRDKRRIPYEKRSKSSRVPLTRFDFTITRKDGTISTFSDEFANTTEVRGFCEQLLIDNPMVTDIEYQDTSSVRDLLMGEPASLEEEVDLDDEDDDGTPPLLS